MLDGPHIPYVYRNGMFGEHNVCVHQPKPRLLQGHGQIVLSGYDMFGQMPGNVMIVFQLPSADDLAAAPGPAEGEL